MKGQTCSATAIVAGWLQSRGSLADLPPSVCPVLGTWALSKSKTGRDTAALADRLVGTRGSEALTIRRAAMCVDWQVRVYAPAWLDRAGLHEHADALRGLPEIRGLAPRDAIDALHEATCAALRRERHFRPGSTGLSGCGVWNASGDLGRFAARTERSDKWLPWVDCDTWDEVRHAASNASDAAARAIPADEDVQPVEDALHASECELFERMLAVNETTEALP